MLVLGDSKTNVTQNAWPWQVALSARLGYGMYDLSATLSSLTTGDERMAAVASNIAATLAANDGKGTNGNFPLILVNIGTHDILSGSTPDQATWIANYRTVLAALHSGRAATPIYLMRDWVNTFDTKSDLIDGWIDTVIANEQADGLQTFAGPDERTWFKPNVGTYSSDGVHYYLAPGQAACVAQWKAILGF